VQDPSNLQVLLISLFAFCEGLMTSVQVSALKADIQRRSDLQDPIELFGQHSYVAYSGTSCIPRVTNRAPPPAGDPCWVPISKGELSSDHLCYLAPVNMFPSSYAPNATVIPSASLQQSTVQSLRQAVFAFLGLGAYANRQGVAKFQKYDLVVARLIFKGDAREFPAVVVSSDLLNSQGFVAITVVKLKDKKVHMIVINSLMRVDFRILKKVQSGSLKVKVLVDDALKLWESQMSM